MSNDYLRGIKKEDKKSFKGFSITMVVCAILGVVTGFTFASLEPIIGKNIPSVLINILKTITPFVSLILSILVIIVSKIIYTNSRKGYELWKQKNEDDDSIDKIEENLSYIILFTSVNLILGCFFLGIGHILSPFDNIDGELSIIKTICFSIGFILCFISTILTQNKVVNLEKEINPFLKGSVYDMKFVEKWVDSCDESIKMEIYKNSYKAFKSVSTTCIILWLFCMMGCKLWDFGIMPMVMVIIIWIVQTISYCIESIKYTKTK